MSGISIEHKEDMKPLNWGYRTVSYRPGNTMVLKDSCEAYDAWFLGLAKQENNENPRKHHFEYLYNNKWVSLHPWEVEEDYYNEDKEPSCSFRVKDIKTDEVLLEILINADVEGGGRINLQDLLNQDEKTT